MAPAAAAEGDATLHPNLSSLSPASSPDGIARAHDFAMMVRVWELLKLDPSNAKRQLEVGPRFALALLGMPSAETSAIASQLEAHVELLMRTGAGPTALPGAAVAGLPEVPPHMRGTLIGMVHVLCRIRNESPELETPAQLRSYLQGECDGLLAKLAGEFWAVEHFERGEDGEPRWVGKELRRPTVSSGADAELNFVTAERCVACETHNPPPAPCVHLPLHASSTESHAICASVISPSLRVCFVDPIQERMTDASATPGGYLPTECIFFLHGSTSTCCTWTRTCVLAVRTSACMTHIWILAQS